MKSLLICPADRSGVALLAENCPLALAPLLGKSVIEYWLEALVARGVKNVIVLASDRPQLLRQFLGDGARWGISIDFHAPSREWTVAEARAKFRIEDSAAWISPDDAVVMDYLPGQPEHALFESYAGWFAAVEAFLPRAASPARIGARQVQPGVWIGLHAQIAPTAQLIAPCWIGDHTLVNAGARIGSYAIIEDRVVIEEGAKISQSVIGPETFVGELISVERSLAHGATLINWTNGSCLRVPDAFFLCSLTDRHFEAPSSNLLGRALALFALAVTAPVAMATMAWSSVRGDPPVMRRLAVRPQRRVRTTTFPTFTYYELTAGKSWLRRWPQFWSVVRGDFAWIGNRPLLPTQALALANDFERLWLTAPVGLVSLADVHGCTDEITEQACAHSSFYAVNANRRLNAWILSRGLFRAALIWPIRWTRHKATTVRLPQLVPKQET